MDDVKKSTTKCATCVNCIYYTSTPDNRVEVQCAYLKVLLNGKIPEGGCEEYCKRKN